MGYPWKTQQIKYFASFSPVRSRGQQTRSWNHLPAVGIQSLCVCLFLIFLFELRIEETPLLSCRAGSIKRAFRKLKEQEEFVCVRDHEIKTIAFGLALFFRLTVPCKKFNQYLWTLIQWCEHRLIRYLPKFYLLSGTVYSYFMDFCCLNFRHGT